MEGGSESLCWPLLAPRSAARALQPSFGPRYCSYAFKDNLFLRRITNNSLPQCTLHGTEILAVWLRDTETAALAASARHAGCHRLHSPQRVSRRLSRSAPLTTCPHPLATNPANRRAGVEGAPTGTAEGNNQNYTPPRSQGSWARRGRVGCG